MTIKTTVKTIALITAGLCFLPSVAAAQYYEQPQHQYRGNTGHGLIGVDPGLRHGVYPSVGVGIGQVGAGVSAGLGTRGIGSGISAGVGPLGATGDAGLNRNGLGLRASSGLGSGTGANVETGFGPGGLGAGASAKLLGFGSGASLGFGHSGPGIGASIALGPIGTIQLGSHANTYPGAERTYSAMNPNVRQTYYQPRPYGNQPVYRGSLIQPQYQQQRQVVRAPYQRGYSHSHASHGHSGQGQAVHSHSCPPGWSGQCR